MVAFACSLLFVAGLPFCTRAGLELLDVTDRYGVSYYLLGGCFVEICMFHLDFGWDRLAAHVRQATLGNKATPNGRTFQPVWFWKLCLYVTVPAFTVVLFLQLWVQDLSKPYVRPSLDLSDYDRVLRESWVGREIEEARNIRPG